MKNVTLKTKGFTLIELLIVVAIIAILAAIAVPNFLEAQNRSKISRAKADFRTLAIALEVYCTDYQKYPPSISVGHVTGTTQLDLSLYRLTTPVAYMTSVSLYDPFGKNIKISNDQHTRPIYLYWNYEPILSAADLDQAAMAIEYNGIDSSMAHRAFCLWSPGPNQTDDRLYWCDFADLETGRIPFAEGDVFYPQSINLIYDPSNGTVSFGDLARVGGAIRFNDLPIDK